MTTGAWFQPASTTPHWAHTDIYAGQECDYCCDLKHIYMVICFHYLQDAIMTAHAERWVHAVCFHADVVTVFSLKRTDSHPRDEGFCPYLCYTNCYFDVFCLFARRGFSSAWLSADDSIFKAAGCQKVKVFWKCTGLPLGSCKRHFTL